MGYFGSRHNPLFGNSVTDETPSSATWYGEKCYRNLTIANGVTIQAAGSQFGPLVIRCSGILTVAGILHADAKATIWFDYGDCQWNGGCEYYPSGGKGTAGSFYGNPCSYMQESGQSLLPAFPIPGGGGYHYGSILHTCTNKYLQAGIYSHCEVATSADGDSILYAGKDPADCVDMLRGPIALGCGGGAAYGNWSNDGGAGGSAILIFARKVIVAAGGIIRANGANGMEDPGVAGTGGGGGGMVGILTESYTNDGTVQALGGTGGLGQGSEAGHDGGDGMNGVVKIQEAA